MNGMNNSATERLCLISHLARFWADHGLPGSDAFGLVLINALISTNRVISGWSATLPLPD